MTFLSYVPSIKELFSAAFVLHTYISLIDVYRPLISEVLTKCRFAVKSYGTV